MSLNLETMEVVADFSRKETEGIPSVESFNQLLLDLSAANNVAEEYIPQITAAEFKEMASLYNKLGGEEFALGMELYMRDRIPDLDLVFNFSKFLTYLKERIELE